MKRKFFDTWFARFAGLEDQQQRVLKYAVENNQQVLSTNELSMLVQPVRTILKTPMAELFDRLLACDQLTNFAAFYTPSKDSIPELLTANNITLDLKQFSNGHVVQGMPKLHDKILVNITNTIRRDGYGEVSINSIDTFQNLFVRGQLVAGYNDLDDWISPSTQEFVIRSYSMILSSMISRYYNLTVVEQMAVCLHFALYMSQMLTGGNIEETHPPIFYRCTTLAKRPQLEEVADACVTVSKDGLDTGKICGLIAEHGPEKMSKFDQTAMYALCDNLGPDAITSRLALEYPPYWVYLLVLALSGAAKIPLIYQLNAQRLLNEGRSSFLNKLYHERVFDLDRPLRP